MQDRIETIRRNREWGRSLLQLLLFLAVVYLTFTYLVGFALVRGKSMYPSLKENEVLLFYRLDKQYYPGDILIIHMAENTEYVKRVIAVEGDVVDIEEETGTLLINGEPPKEDYAYTQPTYKTSEQISFPLELKEGELFVLGDNREISRDSREFGCISLSQVTGRVLLHTGFAF